MSRSTLCSSPCTLCPRASPTPLPCSLCPNSHRLLLPVPTGLTCPAALLPVPQLTSPAPPAAFATAAGPKSLHRDYSEGYSWCLQEAVQFLTLHAASDTQMKLLCHFQRPPAAPAAPAKEPSTPTPGAAPLPIRPSTKASPAARPSACGLWRPW